MAKYMCRPATGEVIFNSSELVVSEALVVPKLVVAESVNPNFRAAEDWSSRGPGRGMRGVSQRVAKFGT